MVYDFESDIVGSEPVGWDDVSSSGCSAKVSQDVANSGLKSVKFIDSNNNGWAILDIENMFDDVEMSFSIYMFDIDRLLYLYSYEDDVGSDILTYCGFSNDAKFYAYNGISGVVLLNPYIKEQWYNFRVVFDLDSDTYDLYIDDVLEADNFDFYNGVATSFKSCRFMSSKTLDIGLMGYVDDVIIGLLPEEVNITFYHNEGGIFRVDNATITNETQISYYNGSVIELASLPQNSSFIFSHFEWNSNNATVNPYNFTVTSNMTIWCYFSIPLIDNTLPIALLVSLGLIVCMLVIAGIKIKR